MKLKIKGGTTDKLVRLFIQDSTSTTGAGLTGLTSASAGLVAYWIAEGDATATSISLQSGTVGTHVDGGFAEIDSTNMAGLYELGLPDAAVDASSNGSVVVMLSGATNMVPVLLEIELDSVDYQNATSFGLSNLNATVSSRSTFNPSSDTVANVTTTGSVSGNVAGSVGSVTGSVGSVAGSVGSVVAAVTTDSASRTASKATLADLTGVALASGQLTSANVSNAVWDVAVSGYNNAGTFGRGFRQVKEGLISGDGQAASNGTTTSFVSNLTSSVDDFYNEKTIVFTSGALAGQSRIISDYDGTTKTVTVDTREPFTSAIQSGDEFILLAIHQHTMSEIVNSIWSEPQTNFASDTGSFGYYLDAAVSSAGGGGSVTVSDITQAALAKFASVDTGETTAVDGSVAKISQGSAGGNVTVDAFTQAALASFVTTDTGQTVAADGSVAKISQGSAGGNVTVGAFTQAALANFANTDTGETSIVDGSVVSLAGGYVINSAQSVAASDVRSGVPIGGSSVGTLVVPSEADVEIGVQYGASGTEFTGSLSSLPTTDSLPIVNNGNVKNIIAGDTYRDGFGDVPSWNWAGGSFPAYAAGATAKIVLSMRTRPADRTEISLTVDDSGSPVVLKLELTPEQSGAIVSGSYRYDIEIEWSNGDTKTMAFGDLFVYEPYSLQK